MKTSSIRAMTHLYLMSQLSLLPPERQTTLHEHYAPLVLSLHRERRYKRAMELHLAVYNHQLNCRRSYEQAASTGLDDLIHLHTNQAYRKHFGADLPHEVMRWEDTMRLCNLYLLAAQALLDGINAALRHAHSDDTA